MNPRARAGFRRAATAFLLFLLLFSALGARAAVPIFSVTNTNPFGLGSLEAAIWDANTLPSGSSFRIEIRVDGAMSTTTRLYLVGKHGWIESRPGTTITGFSSEIWEGGSLTLQDVHIDNSGHHSSAVSVTDDNPGNTLLLRGSNSIKGNLNNIPCIAAYNGKFAIDKAAGGTDLDSTLILTNAVIAVRGATGLTMKGGTVEVHANAAGVDGGLLVTGGRLIATGGIYGIVAHDFDPPPKINAGTVVARGGNADIETAMYIVIINGGSVDARTVFPYVRDDGGNTLYLVTVTVGDPPVKDTEVTCSVNGGAAFACITDEDGKLYLWMPWGDGAAEIGVGGTVYRASGDVRQNYDNEMLALADPVVTGVAVTPASASRERGSSLQFSALVQGEHNPPQDVVWAVENGHAGTAIDDSGLLTISAGETSRTLFVTATSTFDTTYSDTAEVAVLAVSRAAMLLLIALFLVFLLILILLLL